MASRQLEQLISWIIKIGLFGVTVLPLVITTSMLFPFITGKNFIFRIIIEIIFALWLGLIVAWPQYRPKLTLLVKLSTAFIFIVFLADLLSPNPYRSFFSNYERMEGFMMTFHLWLYFLMLISVFKSLKDWLIFVHVALTTSLAVGFIGIMQRFGYTGSSFQSGYRIDATIGNATYLAAYLSFYVWWLIFLIHKFWAKRWLRILYGTLLLFELFIIALTASRGAAIGLFMGALSLLLGGIIIWPKLFPSRPANRKIAIGLFVFVVLIPVIFWQIRNTSIIPPNSIFSRLASISLEERTTKARFSLWGMSFNGFLERPILGWGQENYYLVFQKYFNPKLADSEPWFDRSHNIFLDWLVHAGILGVGAFFSIIGAAFYVLWRGLKRETVSPWEGIIFVAALVSYFSQNLFVFDNLNTYLMFFAILAYINNRTSGFIYKVAGKSPLTSAYPRERFFAVAMASLLIIVISGYYLHVQPMKRSNAIIQALIVSQQGGSGDQIIDSFKKALSYKGFGATEVREQLATVARDVQQKDNLSPEERKRIVGFAGEEMRKEIAISAKDVKHIIFLAAILARNIETPEAYLEAEALMKEAIRISPTKQILYFQLGELYIREQRFQEAVEVLKTAADLNPTWLQANLNLVLVGLFANRQDIVEEARANLKEYNLALLDNDALKVYAASFVKSRDYGTAKVFYQALTSRYHIAQDFAMLAALEAELGEYEEAKAATIEAVRLDPAYAKEAEVFLQLIGDKQKK